LVTALDADECFALRQLCSTAYLSSGRLDDDACAGLLRAKLAWKDRDGYWSATTKGKKVFLRLEDDRRAGALEKRSAGVDADLHAAVGLP
jgi:hypothetical protein